MCRPDVDTKLSWPTAALGLIQHGVNVCLMGEIYSWFQAVIHTGVDACGDKHRFSSPGVKHASLIHL